MDGWKDLETVQVVTWSCVHCTERVVTTYQEAHEVKGKHSGHPSERQSLQHRAADTSRVTVVFGPAVGGTVLLTSTCPTNHCRHGNNQHLEQTYCHMPATDLRREKDTLNGSL